MVIGLNQNQKTALQKNTKKNNKKCKGKCRHGENTIYNKCVIYNNYILHKYRNLYKKIQINKTTTL